MIKKFIVVISAIILTVPFLAAAVQISVPSAPGSGYSLISSTTGLYSATTTGIVTCTGATCNSGSYVFGQPLNINVTASGGGASSTLLGDSSTFSGTLNTFSNAPKLGSLSGILYGNSGTLNTQASSSETCSSPLSCTGFDVLKNGGAITIQQANGTQNGYLSSSDYLTFNNKVATGTNFVSSNVAYFGSNGTLFNTGTSSGSCSGGASCSNFVVLGSSGPTISVFNYLFTSTTVGSGFPAAGTSTILYPTGLFTGTSTVGALTASSSIKNQSVKSAIVVDDAAGLEIAYTGSANPCTNQVPTTISALGVSGGCTSINNAWWSGTQLAVANGGTNATSFTTSGNAVYYDGAKLSTALTTASVTTPFASSTSLSSTGAGMFATGTGNVTIGTSTQSLSGGQTPLLVIDGQNNSTSEDAVFAGANLNDFWQYDCRNRSTGTNAQCGYSATRNDGTQTTNFVWMGVNNTGFNMTSPSNIGNQGDGDILSYANDFWIGQGTSGQKTYFTNGGIATTSITLTLDSSGGNNKVGIGSTTPYAFVSLQVPATSTLSTLFTIASSVSGATTTAFNVSNVGSSTVTGSGFDVRDKFNTLVSSLSTGSTTGPIFAIFATTSTASSCGGLGLSCLWQFDQYGHVAASSTVPVLSSCGTSPSLSPDSSDYSGTITVGSVAATACTLTFGSAHTVGTHCVISEQTGSVVNASSYTEDLTGFTYSQTGLTSDKLDYICTGI